MPVTPVVLAEDSVPFVGSSTTTVTVTLPEPSSVMVQPLRVARSAPGALRLLGSATTRRVAVVATVGAAMTPSKSASAKLRASMWPVADSRVQSAPRAAAPVASVDEATSAPVRLPSAWENCVPSAATSQP